jgi:hypothetical protein
MSVVIKVAPLLLRGWHVELSPAKPPYTFDAKGPAIVFALNWAENHQPCEVHVYGGAGDVERRMTLPNGNYRHVKNADRRRSHLEIAFPDRREGDRRIAA